MLILQAAYIVFVILLAKVNSNIIKNNRKVWHFGNALLHLTIACFTSFIWWWGIGLAILCNTRVFFDSFLNYFRFGRINYVSSSPASFIDRMELRVFGNEFYLPKMMYLLTSLSLNCFYYILIYK
jgi:hypothetical protein